MPGWTPLDEQAPSPASSTSGRPTIRTNLPLMIPSQASHIRVHFRPNYGSSPAASTSTLAYRGDAPQSRSAIQAAWMASRIFSLDRLGSSPKSGSSITQRCRSVKRRLTLSTSGWCSSSSIAMSRTSVQRSFFAISPSSPRLLVDHHVARRRRQLDHQAVERLAHADLAAEARGMGEAERQVEHVLLILAGRRQLLEPDLLDDDVAGRAGQRALAGALDIDAVAMGDFEHAETERRIHLLARA